MLEVVSAQLKIIHIYYPQHQPSKPNYQKSPSLLKTKHLSKLLTKIEKYTRTNKDKILKINPKVNSLN